MNNATKNRNESCSYRIPVALQFAWSLIICTGLISLPETPRYLIKRDNFEKAAKALSKLRRLPPNHPALLESYVRSRLIFGTKMALGKAIYQDALKGTVRNREMDEVDTRKMSLRETSDMVEQQRSVSAGNPEAQANYGGKTKSSRERDLNRKTCG